MSLFRDLWMTPAKRRLIRRTVANGPYGPPDGTEVFGSLVVPSAGLLTATATGATTLTVGALVIFNPDPSTGTPEARKKLETLRAIVDTVAGSDVTFSTDPTDLTGTDFTGIVLNVLPLE